MLKKKSFVILAGIMVLAAACSGSPELSSLPIVLADAVEVEQQPALLGPADQQVPQGQFAQQGQQAPQVQLQNSAVSDDTVIVDANIEGQFASNVTVTFTDTYMIVESNGIPNHEIGNDGTRNVATEQNFRFMFPLNPELAAQPTETSLGPIGIALSGAVFYNGSTSDGQNAVELEILDHCGGHADGRGVYHYHEESDCIHGNLMGYAFDGFEVRKNIENDGSAVTGLDECNGHSHDGEYHYHATDDPSQPLIGCFAGVVETSNINAGGAGGPGGNAGPGGQAPGGPRPGGPGGGG